MKRRREGRIAEQHQCVRISRAGERDARLTQNPSDSPPLHCRTHRHLGELEGAGTMGHHGAGADHVIAEEGEVDHAAGIDDRGLRIGEDGEVGGLEHEEKRSIHSRLRRAKCGASAGSNGTMRTGEVTPQS